VGDQIQENAKHQAWPTGSAHFFLNVSAADCTIRLRHRDACEIHCRHETRETDMAKAILTSGRQNKSVLKCPTAAL
jgi:hypothetical protein